MNGLPSKTILFSSIFHIIPIIQNFFWKLYIQICRWKLWLRIKRYIRAKLVEYRGSVIFFLFFFYCTGYYTWLSGNFLEKANSYKQFINLRSSIFELEVIQLFLRKTSQRQLPYSESITFTFNKLFWTDLGFSIHYFMLNITQLDYSFEIEKRKALRKKVILKS